MLLQGIMPPLVRIKPIRQVVQLVRRHRHVEHLTQVNITQYRRINLATAKGQHIQLTQLINVASALIQIPCKGFDTFFQFFGGYG
jgi:hypothetical protein